ncbi:unnamed protein product, partial [Polarella glacialis]
VFKVELGGLELGLPREPSMLATKRTVRMVSAVDIGSDGGSCSSPSQQLHTGFFCSVFVHVYVNMLGGECFTMLSGQLLLKYRKQQAQCPGSNIPPAVQGLA